MADSPKPVFAIPKCKVTYMADPIESRTGGMWPSTTTHLPGGPRYRVVLVDGDTVYWAGEYPVSEFSAAVSTAHRVAKRAQTARYNNVATLLKAMESPKE